MQAGSKSPEQPNRPRATPNHAARALHELGMEVDPSHRGPLERLAADLNGHVAEPFRSCLNSAAGAGAKVAPAPVVLGQGDYRHNGNGKLLDDEASRAIAATHPGITQREMDERTRRRVARVRGRALCWPTVAEILNAPGRLTATLADLRQVEALRTAACCLEGKGPVAERMRQDILDAIHELDPASCPCCGIETETDPNPDGRGPWRACVSCSWNQSTRNEGGAA